MPKKFMQSTEVGEPAINAALRTLAEDILRSVVEDGFCIVQDWDNRIDCSVKLPDGRFAGEMVGLATLTSAKIREVGMRLKAHQLDESVELENELIPPILIRSTSASN